MTGDARRDTFERDGYLVVPEFVDGDEVRRLSAAIETAAADDPEENPLSLGTMRFASNVYRHHERIRAFVGSDRVVELLTAVGGPDLWLRWDQAVWKLAGAPEFPWHQDNGYSGLAATHLQLWVALTPVHPDNGGLLVCPGGHRRMLEHRYVGNHVHAEPPGEPVAIRADAGDAILFSSFLPHATAPNRSGEPRLAYVAEFLPLAVDDVSVPLPHLVVARDGLPDLHWSSAPAHPAGRVAPSEG